MKTVKINPPKKYLLRYKKNGEVKFYKIAPIEDFPTIINAYAYANYDTKPGIRSFKKENIVSIDRLTS